VPSARLVIAGGGDDRERLEAKAAGLGIDRSVVFEGVVPPDRLAALYRDAAVFAMPSANEGFGLVYVEAMAAGTPCIAAAGAAEEIVSHGVDGRIVSPGDRDALASALVELIENPVVRHRMGQAAQRAAQARFSPAAFAERWCALLDVGPVARPRRAGARAQPAEVEEAAC
jgi:glycosyltransferase involved in cell wall biosynthesis